jgi:hypothetical protein
MADQNGKVTYLNSKSVEFTWIGQVHAPNIYVRMGLLERKAMTVKFTANERQPTLPT